MYGSSLSLSKSVVNAPLSNCLANPGETSPVTLVAFYGSSIVPACVILQSSQAVILKELINIFEHISDSKKSTQSRYYSNTSEDTLLKITSDITRPITGFFRRTLTPTHTPPVRGRGGGTARDGNRAVSPSLSRMSPGLGICVFVYFELPETVTVPGLG